MHLTNNEYTDTGSASPPNPGFRPTRALRWNENRDWDNTMQYYSSNNTNTII
jgi:hypothetical protein